MEQKSDVTATVAPPAAVSTPGGPAAPMAGRVFQRLDLTPGYPYTIRYYIRRFAWQFVQATLIRHSPRRADKWRRFWLRAFGAEIHHTSITKASTKILLPWDFKMGRHSCMADGVETWGPGPVTIGDHTIISRDVLLCAGTHDYTKANLPLVVQPIVVGSGVWIGAQAWVSGNVTLGDNCLIGARAVVTKSVPANMIAAGNPAKVIKERRMDWDQEIMNTPERA
jgi:putative colanic acid biosynthesis acetyltransferase WcaF